MNDELRAAMAEWTTLTGRAYAPIDAYRCDDASEVLVAMGTLADTATAVVDHLRTLGRQVGCVTVTSFRPFPATEIAAAVRGATTVGVLERTDEPAAADNPLTREVKAGVLDSAADGHSLPRVVSGSAGLGSRDVGAGDLVAFFDWLAEPGDRERHHVVLGIRHPLGLESVPTQLRPAGAYSLRGHSIGGFGSVTTNKLLASLVGELFGRHVQAYPRYGSEKKGLPTTYFLTIADERVRLHGDLDRVDFVPLYDVAAFGQGDPLAGLVDGGTVFVQTPLTDPEQIWQGIPAPARAEILARRIRVTALDTAELARANAPRPDLVVRMQGVALVGVFLRVAPFAAQAGFDEDDLMAAVRRQLARFFGKRGGKVVDANLEVVRAAYAGLIDVTAAVTGAATGLAPTEAAAAAPVGAA
jgi:pyruvate-ferredoxin/flavodoxin oxidoreductase